MSRRGGCRRCLRKLGLEVAVRGGGHNVAGCATIDQRVDDMKHIYVDPDVGLQLRPRVHHLGRGQPRGHSFTATGGVVSHTGVAGLTLGGGLGWLMGKHAPYLLSSNWSPPKERFCVRARTNRWALRAAAKSWGSAQRPPVYGRPHGLRYSSPCAAVLFATTPDLPDEHMIFGGLIHAPDGLTKLAAMVTCHCGSPADGEMAESVSGSARLAPGVGPIPYRAKRTRCRLSKGRSQLLEIELLSELNDAAYDHDRVHQAPMPMGQLLIEHFHGVVHGSASKDRRSEGYNFLERWIRPRTGHHATAGAEHLRSDVEAVPLGAARDLGGRSGEPLVDAYGPN